MTSGDIFVYATGQNQTANRGAKHQWNFNQASILIWQTKLLKQSHIPIIQSALKMPQKMFKNLSHTSLYASEKHRNWVHSIPNFYEFHQNIPNI